MIEDVDVVIPYIKDEEELKKDFQEFVRINDFKHREIVAEISEELAHEMNQCLIDINHLMIKIQQELDPEKAGLLHQELLDANIRQYEVWGKVTQTFDLDPNKSYYYNPVKSAIHLGSLEFQP